MASFEERMAKAEEILTLYQNAKFVITRRLHVTLPCLALETPVLSIVDLKDAEGNGTRWGCYMDTVRCIDNEISYLVILSMISIIRQKIKKDILLYAKS
mgnify:CR=1 FL=1